MDYLSLYQLAQRTISERSATRKTSAIVPIVELKAAVVAAIDWLIDINFHPVETKAGDPLGHYECYSDTESRDDHPDSWVALITYANHLNWCQKRFVWCKEMMHIFDTEDGYVQTPDVYRGLLTEIELKPIDPSGPYLTENMAKWKALLVLCPKEQRDAVKAEFANSDLTEYEVAVRFRIPEGSIKSLFSDYYDVYYERFIASLL